MTIPEIIAEQRRRSRSPNPAERLAAGLLIPKLLRERLNELRDHQVGRLLEDEVCSNLSVLAPELTVCMEAAERLCRSPSSQVHGTQALASSAAHRSRLLAKSSALEKQVSEHERR